jgi:type VI secretion system protein VasD
MKTINFIIFFLCLILSSCGSDPPKEEPKVEETKIQANIIVSNDVNPDVNGRPSPVVVRIYELKNLGKFDEADFFKLLEDHEGALGSDLLASEKFHLKPGETKEIAHPVSPETKYIAVSAAFRDFNRAVWRYSTPIENAKTSELAIKLNNVNISIEKANPPK